MNSNVQKCINEQPGRTPSQEPRDCPSLDKRLSEHFDALNVESDKKNAHARVPELYPGGTTLLGLLPALTHEEKENAAGPGQPGAAARSSGPLPPGGCRRTVPVYRLTFDSKSSVECLPNPSSVLLR